MVSQTHGARRDEKLIIDAHAHLLNKDILNDVGRQFARNMGWPIRSGDDGVRDMDLANIDKMVLLSTDSELMSARIGRPTSIPFDQCNDAVARVVEQYPDRYIGFAGIDPRRGGLAIAELERCVHDLGLRGVKLWQLHGYFPDNLEFYPFYERVQALGVPILCHTGKGPPGTYLKYTRPVNVSTVATDFPKITFILAHMGNPWVDEATVVAQNNANVYLDLSGWQNRVIHSPVHLARALCTAKYRCGIDRVLFGSDWPLCESALTLTQWVQAVQNLETPDVLRQLGFPEITEQDKKLILGDNAAKILDI